MTKFAESSANGSTWGHLPRLDWLIATRLLCYYNPHHVLAVHNSLVIELEAKSCSKIVDHG